MDNFRRHKSFYRLYPMFRCETYIFYNIIFYDVFLTLHHTNYPEKKSFSELAFILLGENKNKM